MTELLASVTGRQENAQGPRLTLLHGFTQNSLCWGRFGDEIASHRPVTMVDLPGHGESGHDDADLWRSATLVSDTVGEPSVIVGYSMGGRVALHAAIAHPNSVRGLVLIGATAGIIDDDERENRRQSDAKLGQQLAKQGLNDFIDGWLDNPLFYGLDEHQKARAQRLTNRTDGLIASLANCGTGSQTPLWDRLGEISVPVLFITGTDDTKFCRLAEQMSDRLTGVTWEHLTLPGTHAIHQQHPISCAQAILDRTTDW